MKNVSKLQNNAYLKRPINKLFTVENTYGTNQTDEAKEENLRQEAAVIGELTRKYKC